MQDKNTSQHLVVVENRKDWKAGYPDIRVVDAKAYLSQPEFLEMRRVKVINLCRHYKYLETGYYCSLLAEARHHRALPSIRTITDLSSRLIYSLNTEELEGAVQRALAKHQLTRELDRFELDIIFGFCKASELQNLARQIYEVFPCPLLRVEFRRDKTWRVGAIRTLSLNTFSEEQSAFFVEACNKFLQKPLRIGKPKQPSRYDMAILRNPNETIPPSDMGALQKFAKAGKKFGIDVEIIEKKDYASLAEYDALFIRETTNINHYTYRFAKKAEAEGMVVIDDPDSIVRCTNKVYLSELLASKKIPTPRSAILHKSSSDMLPKDMGFPMVLKIPDGSFSRGVYKANTEEEAKTMLAELFKKSDLILAQEFLYTDFDWRVGILNRKPLFACKYFMFKAHWQIVKHEDSGQAEEGNFETFLIEDVPPTVISTALAAANLIGDGLYGVDLKQKGDKVYIIEVNDNPNLDAGVEDAKVGDALYETIMAEFLRRLELRRKV